MNAVAEKVGISKGGLLYHFPSKEALESSLHKRFVASMGRRLAEGELTADSLLSAMLAYKLKGKKHFAPLMLSAANGKLPKALQAFGAALLEQLGTSHSRCSYRRVAFFAILGIILSDLLNLVPVSNDDTAEIRFAIETLVNDDPWDGTKDPPV